MIVSRQWASVAFATLAVVFTAGCACDGEARDAGDSGPDGTGGAVSNLFVDVVKQWAPSKVDLLFMVDNSLSMADKQALLKDAVPDLVRRLVSPNCVDLDGRATPTPLDIAAPCPKGTDREFGSIKDIHVGVITSSLGAVGSTVCDAEAGNDQGHLIATRPRFATEAAKYAGKPFQAPETAGFLNWNPGAGGQLLQDFDTTFQLMVTAAGEVGCGYEAQLESIYRFLVDPEPSTHVVIDRCPGSSSDCAYPTGRDLELLNQRAAFLRPDSVVGIVMLSDENDCSIPLTMQSYYPSRVDQPMPPATAACAKNPNDACCRSCAAAAPSGCAADPTCTTMDTLPPELDSPNLRCFEQKRRFGFDFLQPTSRYVNALQQPRLCTSRNDLAVDPSNPNACRDANGDGKPDLVDNPLFAAPPGMTPRAPDMVVLAGILGVPWQDLQATKDESGLPFPADDLHYKTAAQLESDQTWAVILGEPHPQTPANAAPIPPLDSLMLESVGPRQGNDGQGDPLAPPSSAPLANRVNGHEWGNIRQDDLMYSCIFALPEPRDCAATAGEPSPRRSCDCRSVVPGDSNPLCQDPQSGQYGTTQHFAKAYPSLRELNVLKDFGANSVVASICARNLTDPSAQDYGYRPAMDAVADRLALALGGRCLPRRIPLTAGGDFPCHVIEARPAGGACDPSRGRTPLDDFLAGPARQRLETQGLCGGAGPGCDSFTLCELAEAGPECHQAGAQPKAGFCYVDPSQNPDDEPALVERCRASEKRILRFVDPDYRTPEPDATVLITCDSIAIED